MWIRIHKVSGLDLCIRVGDVYNKENWTLNFGKNEMERLGILGHLTIAPTDHHLLEIGYKL